MNAYEEKLERRRERLEDRADNARTESNRRLDAANVIADGIPMGQPILVGHHSEKHHRRDIARIDNNMRKGIAAAEEADELARRAASVGTGGVSSDDPEAVRKLKEQLSRLVQVQGRMKAANKAVRIKDEAKRNAAFAALGFTEKMVAQLLTPDFCGRIGFPSYEITNNGANIRRIEKRIEELSAKSNDVTTEREENGVQIIDSVEENRLQLIFPGKPSADVIAALKSSGFRWSPTAGAWQRHRSNAATFHASQIVAMLSPKAEVQS